MHTKFSFQIIKKIFKFHYNDTMNWLKVYARTVLSDNANCKNLHKLQIN